MDVVSDKPFPLPDGIDPTKNYTNKFICYFNEISYPPVMVAGVRGKNRRRPGSGPKYALKGLEKLLCHNLGFKGIRHDQA